ncbi:hypothetical protein F4808DRAFT_459044 [Astrocystis sublimbata]|nr:hypothetical protein F4808DRAFT_459044 [Astrocystis sublimbata]
MASSTPSADFPKPKYVTGGCLCGSLRYRIEFPEGHDFEKNSITCQCTQDRRNTGSFFFPSHNVPAAAFRWTSTNSDTATDTDNTDKNNDKNTDNNDSSTLGRYHATPTAERGFCTRCGSFMYWRRLPDPNTNPDTDSNPNTNPNTNLNTNSNSRANANTNPNLVPSSPGLIGVTVGTIDPLFLFGEGADAECGEGEDGENDGVPEKGFGLALASGRGGHEWCANEIPGVTDKENMRYFYGGRRFGGDAEWLG